MSFYRITDPRKRDAMVEEYLATVKRMKQRNFDERLGELAQQRERRDVLNPLIESNNKTSNAITNELRPMKKEIEDLNKHLRNENALVTPGRKRKRNDIGPKYILEEGDRSRQDMYFGIQKDSKNRFILGNKEIKIDENNNDIRVDGVTYQGSPGLWSLVMDISPIHYTNDDYENYKRLVLQTDLINNPTGVQPNSKPKRTNKYKNFLAKIIDEHESKNNDGDDDDDYEVEEKEKEEKEEEQQQEKGDHHGHGIQFLPSTIKGLFEKLQLLAAEFIAGNTTTKNELVAVLDELRRRKSITEKEYTTINTLLSKS